MKYKHSFFSLLLPILLLASSCGTSTETVDSENSGDVKSEEKVTVSQDLVKAVKFDAIEALMNDESGNLQVINFWATWCGPCVKELPSFEKANEKFATQGVGFTLVSIDFVEDLNETVAPFVKKKGLKSNVVLLDDDQYDTWIHKISGEWDGAIPATLFVNKKKGIREIIIGQVEYDKLDETISKHLEL